MSYSCGNGGRNRLLHLSFHPIVQPCFRRNRLKWHQVLQNNRFIYRVRALLARGCPEDRRKVSDSPRAVIGSGEFSARKKESLVKRQYQISKRRAAERFEQWAK